MAGAVTLLALLQLLPLATAVFAGETLIQRLQWMPAARAGSGVPPRRAGAAVRAADPGHRPAGHPLRPLLPVRRSEPLGPLLRLPAAVHGRHARHRAGRQPAAAVVFWELTSLVVLPADRLTGSIASEARKGARMALAVTGAGGLALLGGLVAARRHRRQLRAATRCSQPATSSARSALSCRRWCWSCSAPSPSRRSSRSTSGCPMPWRRRRRCPPTCTRPPWSRPASSCWRACIPALGGHADVVLAGGGDRPGHAAVRRLLRAVQARPQGPAGLLHHQPSGADHAAARASARRWRRWPALFHIINHATFKASLFMAAGIIDHETGTRDMRRSTGCGEYMPLHRRCWPWWRRPRWPGVPLLNGFLSKEMFFAETAGSPACSADWAWLLPAGRTLGGVFCGGLLAALHPRRVLQRRAATTCRRRRTSRRAGCASRWRCWWCSAWLVGLFPAADRRAAAGPWPRRGAAAGDRRRATTWRSGTASTCRWP